MDTKWNDTKKKLKQIYESNTWLKKNQRDILLVTGAMLTVAGLYYMWDMYQRTSHAYAVQSLIKTAAVVQNILLGAGNSILVSQWSVYQYKKHEVSSEAFYPEWKQKNKRYRSYLIAALAVILVIGAREQRKTYINMEAVESFVGTGILQLGIWFVLVKRCMARCLENYITERDNLVRQNVEKAIRSEKLKVDLISNLSHDLKTPLTSMVGYIELMKKEELNGVMSDYVDVLARKAQKLKEMIDSLFSLSKTSSGNIELNMESMEMNRLVEQVLADMEERIQSADREIVLDLTAEDTAFLSDSGYMYRICQNLMENALKFSAEHTRVFVKTSIAVKNRTRKVRLEVTNTANYRMSFTKEQIVERFVRGDEARTTEGNGLGLAIVSTYAGALGGSFDVTVDCDQFRAMLEVPVKNTD